MRALLFAIPLACAVGLAQADPNLADGKARAVAKCENCHGGGTDAEGDDLGGWPAEKMMKALNEYKARTRKHGGMRKRASEHSDQDIENISAYYAQKPPPPAKK
jgi:cytochrome c553